jgi:hypothetical protein
MTTITHTAGFKKFLRTTAAVSFGIALGAFAIASTAAAEETAPTNVPGIEDVKAPPAGFDAVHASDAALAAYALPPRPNAARSPIAYAKWVRAMSKMTTRVYGQLTTTNRSHGVAANQGSHRNSAIGNTTLTSGNWSGFVNLNNTTSYNNTTSIYYTYADFVIPQATNPTCSGTDYGSAWVGIDGWNSGDVLQGGIGYSATCGYSPSYNAWVEWYPYNESGISLAVAPGDDIFVEVFSTASTVGYVFVENLNSGAYQEYKMSPPSGTKLVGNSAEWIVETPGINGVLATLPDYTYDFFINAFAVNFSGSAFSPGSTTSYPVELDRSGTIYSVPVLEDSSAFYMYYN